jgi:hypothetical protein
MAKDVDGVSVKTTTNLKESPLTIMVPFDVIAIMSLH